MSVEAMSVEAVPKPVLALSFEGVPPESAPERVVSRGASLPVLLRTHALVFGGTGAGKSWLLRQMLEETAGRVRQVVVDPEGEYHTLRDHFPLLLLGAGAGADLDPRALPAGRVVRATAEAGASFILDLSDVPVAERDVLAAGYLRELVETPKALRTPTLVVVDEAQKLAPEGQSTAAAAALVDLAERGRKRGLGVVVATQRLARLLKAVAGLAQNQVIGQATLKVDQKRAGDELGFGAAERRGLAALARGSFYVQGPAFGGAGAVPVLVRTRSDLLTQHPSEDDLGEAPVPEELAGLARALRHMAVAPAPLEAPEQPPAPQTAKRQIEQQAVEAELRSRLSQAEKGLVQVGSQARRYREGLMEAIEQLEALAGATSQVLSDLQRLAGEGLAGGGFGEETLLSENAEGQPAAKDLSCQKRPGGRAFGVASSENGRVGGGIAEGSQKGADAREAPGAGTKRPVAQQRLLQTLARMGRLGMQDTDRRNLAVFARQSPKSSAYAAHVAALEQDGLVHYPQPGRIALTGQGRKATAVHGPKIPGAMQRLSSEDLHEEWYRYLPAYPSALLKVIVAQGPGGVIERSVLAGQAGYSAKSSAFGEAIATLKGLGLVVYPGPGRVAATELLFPPALSRSRAGRPSEA